MVLEVFHLGAESLVECCQVVKSVLFVSDCLLATSDALLSALGLMLVYYNLL